MERREGNALRGSPTTGVADGGVSGGAAGTEHSSESSPEEAVPGRSTEDVFFRCTDFRRTQISGRLLRQRILFPEQGRRTSAASAQAPPRRTRQACRNHVRERPMPFLFHLNALRRNRCAPVSPGLLLFNRSARPFFRQGRACASSLRPASSSRLRFFSWCDRLLQYPSHGPDGRLDLKTI